MPLSWLHFAVAVIVALHHHILLTMASPLDQSLAALGAHFSGTGVEGDYADEAEEASSLGVPCNVWANIMEFLPMDDLLNCSIVNKFFLEKVSPLVSLLVVAKGKNMMEMEVAQRFRGVKTVFVLLSKVSLWANDLLLIPPFLRCFPRLGYFQLAFLPPEEAGFYVIGPYGVRCSRLQIEDPSQHKLIGQRMLRFIQQLCQDCATGKLQALSLNCLPKQLHAPTLGCAFKVRTGAGDHAACPVCRHVCKHFPYGSFSLWGGNITPCVSSRKRLEISSEQHPEVFESFKDKQLWLQFHDHMTTPNNVLTFHEEVLEIMAFLIEKGANAEDPKIGDLLCQRGHRLFAESRVLNAGFDRDNNLPRRLDRKVFELFKKWGVKVEESDFRLVDVPADAKRWY